MERQIYLDANATHPLLKNVKQSLKALIESDFDFPMGNPSSLHASGRRSKRVLSLLKDELEEFTGLSASRWVLCSGATEAINTALSSALSAGYDLAPSAVEHSAVLRFCEHKALGRYRCLDVGSRGDLDLEKLKLFLSERDSSRPLLMVLQTHNNETGFPLITEKNKNGFLDILKTHSEVHVLWDAVQGLAKVDSLVFKDLLAKSSFVVVSGHKIGALPGVGAIWCSEKAPYNSLVLGGTQESARRAGTESFWAAHSWLDALEDWRSNASRYRESWKNLKSYLLNEFKGIEGVEALRFSDSAEALSNTLVLLLKNKKSDLLIQILDQAGFAVGTGSACKSGLPQPSHVLLAMGYSEKEAGAFLRVSFQTSTSQEELALFSKTLKDILNS